MAYRVFLSHSTRDQGLVIALAHLLTKLEVQVYVAEWHLTPGEPLAKKVLAEIRKSDCVVALLTRDGARSSWVHQEIGYSLEQGKLVIPIVEKGVSRKSLGALQGREIVEYDPNDYQETLIRLAHYVKASKLKKEEREKALLVVGGLLVAFLLLAAGSQE
ncbi:MAG: toll/interleukin-1 receptor domain-containing protein [Candidatus Zixiibacteriota bacterium]